MIGYKKTYLPLEVNGQQKQIELTEIMLEPEAQSLAEVTVTARTPTVERRDGALVVNVENSTLAAGNTAMDIITRSPGVSVDKDGNISLMGRQGVTVMIDGKQTFLSAEQLANMLKSMDGSNIQSIELNTNPSAKYDAAGTAGIINIRLKKNKLEGINGSVNLSGGYGRTHKSNNSFDLSYKQGKTNVYTSYSYTDNGYRKYMDLYRTAGQGDALKIFDQLATFQNTRKAHNARLGIDYQTSERNTLSILGSGYFSRTADNSMSNSKIMDVNHVIDSTLTTQTDGLNRFKNISVNVNNTFNVDTNGRKLTTEVDMARFEDNTNNYYLNDYFLPDGTALRDPEWIQNTMPSTIDIQTAKIDYVHPLGKKGKLEFGGKYSNVKSDNDMGFFIHSGASWEQDAERSNRFVYTERVSAAYAIYSQKFNKTDIQAGLRMEHTFSDGHSVTSQQRNKRDYLNLFPNISVNQQLSEQQSIGLSYSRRVNRPNYGNLNPFIYYIEPYTYIQGNPFLNPSFTDSYELNYSLKKRYNLSAGFQKTRDMVGEMMYLDDQTSVTRVTYENIAKELIYFVNLNIPVEIGNWWNSNTNINGLYMAYKADIPEAPIDFEQLGIQLNSSQTFNINETLRLEANFKYQSPLRWSIYKIGSNWGLDLGVNKSLWDKRANIKLVLTDIFYKMPYTASTNYANLNFWNLHREESRVLRLSFTYRFGNQKLKNSQRDIDNSEKSRVGK
ncbi:outer membrane beta-barrel family protein [Olivibacter sitiensis]|uniref:outer membrane beta-barrel family protein n=1 Tax=Olivibacter sitiensis TaxID=376470 RepID=UPI00146FA77D|nr:outer membrane beta-barrel family protein [Olivibacter sitiensis]